MASDFEKPDDEGLDPNFAERFERSDRRPTCQLYLISPLEVGGSFPDRLAEALDAGPVAAFQFRVKGVDQHEAVLTGAAERLAHDLHASDRAAAA